MIRQELLDLLRELSTDQNPHSGRTLMDHLQGTWRLLRDWDNPDEICTAGLFHSVYGTEFYKTRSADLSQREQIRQVIGQRAEQLAYFFSACDRRHMFSNVEKSGDYALQDLFQDELVPIPEDTLRALLEIEAANILDQVPPVEEIPPEQAARWLKLWETARPFLSPKACASVFRYFHAA